MASNIGPLVSMEVTAPKEWNALTSKTHNTLLLKDSLGFGWTVEVGSPSLREGLLLAQEPIRIFIAQILREDAEQYFGFESLVERGLFIELRELDSIGPKMAALILANISFEEIEKLALGTLKQIPRKIPGLGPKIQEKLVLGLKQKGELFLELLTQMKGQPSQNIHSKTKYSPTLNGAPTFVLQSMESLGLKNSETEALWSVMIEENATFEDLDKGEIIRRMLKEWGRMKNPAKVGADKTSPGGAKL